MNVHQAKRFFRKIGIVLACVFGFITLVGGLTCLVEWDHRSDRQIFCAPDNMAHAFYYDHHAHAVCVRNDGSLYLSEKSK